MPPAHINLIVIYTDHRERLRDELAAFGLVFEEHQHGQGPIHDACETAGLCLEIYPASQANPPTHIRLGLNVPNIDEAMKSASSIDAITKAAPQPSPWGIRAVIQLRSGIKVELSQPS
ncbi:hypothetical protein OT109_09825 [Phycisphaeraceae bacterium D3-23]